MLIWLFIWGFQKENRQPGDRWMIRGPLEYVPPVEVDVVTKRKAIPLDENEGIYVRHIKSGKVRLLELCNKQTLNYIGYDLH